MDLYALFKRPIPPTTPLEEAITLFSITYRISFHKGIDVLITYNGICEIRWSKVRYVSIVDALSIIRGLVDDGWHIKQCIPLETLPVDIQGIIYNYCDISTLLALQRTRKSIKKHTNTILAKRVHNNSISIRELLAYYNSTNNSISLTSTNNNITTTMYFSKASLIQTIYKHWRFPEGLHIVEHPPQTAPHESLVEYMVGNYIGNNIDLYTYHNILNRRTICASCIPIYAKYWLPQLKDKETITERYIRIISTLYVLQRELPQAYATSCKLQTQVTSASNTIDTNIMDDLDHRLTDYFKPE